VLAICWNRLGVSGGIGDVDAATEDGEVRPPGMRIAPSWRRSPLPVAPEMTVTPCAGESAPEAAGLLAAVDGALARADDADGVEVAGSRAPLT